LFEIAGAWALEGSIVLNPIVSYFKLFGVRCLMELLLFLITPLINIFTSITIRKPSIHDENNQVKIKQL